MYAALAIVYCSQYTIINALSGINCYCSEEPSAGFPECHWQDYTCSGDVCYVRRTLENGVFYTTWDCLRRSVHHIDLICGGAFDSSTDRYVCCSDSNNCNEHLQIALPIELPTEQSTIIPSTTTQLGPSSSTIVPINNIISPSIIQPSAPAVTLLDSSSIGMQSTKLAIVAPSTVSSVNAAVQSTSLVPESTSVPTAKGNAWPK